MRARKGAAWRISLHRRFAVPLVGGALGPRPFFVPSPWLCKCSVFRATEPMDISFYCFKCGQHIVIDEAGAGLQVKCPKCGRSLTVPQAATDSPLKTPVLPNETPRPGSFAARWIGTAVLVVGLALVVVAVTTFQQSAKATTVEIYVRTQGGETVRLSGAIVEVCKSVAAPHPAYQPDINCLMPIKGFEGIATDADGKAVIKGLKPQYFVVVSDERQILDHREKYLWVVAASDSREGRLLLSQHNLFTGTFEKLILLTPNEINATDNEGLTALHRAVAGGRKLVEFLLAHGAEVNLKNDKDGNTPLHYAAASDRDVAELLIARGADVNARNEMSATPLHYAVVKGNRDAAEVLIARGADLEARDNTGATPLHYAAQMGNTDIAELLIAKGANVNAVNSHGVTPLVQAWSSSHKDVVELLKAHGGR